MPKTKLAIALKAFYENNQGLVIRYKFQDFQIRFDSMSALGGGLYCVALDNGRVRKGDAQFIEWRYLRKFS